MSDFKKDLEKVLSRFNVEETVEEFNNGQPKNPDRLEPIVENLGMKGAGNHLHFQTATPYSVRNSVTNYLASNPEMDDAKKAFDDSKEKIYAEYCKIIDGALGEASKKINEELSKNKGFNELDRDVKESIIRANLIESLYPLIRNFISEEKRKE